MKHRFTLVEQSGDPSHLSPAEIALSRCAWNPIVSGTDAADSTASRGNGGDDEEKTDGLNEQISGSPGSIGTIISEGHQSRTLTKRMHLHINSRAVPASVDSSALWDGDDCEMQFVDAMPSPEGLLMCVLLKNSEASSEGLIRFPMRAVQ